MPIDPLSAANAYRNQIKLAEDAANISGGADESGAAGPSFVKMLENAVQDAGKTQRVAEATEIQSMTGSKVDLTNLVTAVANAELSLNTVVAIRDRVISAYQDIIKMSI
ncbi:MAG: flagellar hook-basal body complex protein FliE [Pseudomonadota bacterium]|nr:flagellar hook-basal body complex protein FliE [Pseudomonadota bacterium]MDE3038002.1 flagellar hook-basal body complex protein FliE [Pseudomonadota bacterium]